MTADSELTCCKSLVQSLLIGLSAVGWIFEASSTLSGVQYLAIETNQRLRVTRRRVPHPVPSRSPPVSKPARDQQNCCNTSPACCPL